MCIFSNLSKRAQLSIGKIRKKASDCGNGVGELLLKAGGLEQVSLWGGAVHPEEAEDQAQKQKEREVTDNKALSEKQPNKP